MFPVLSLVSAVVILSAGIPTSSMRQSIRLSHSSDSDQSESPTLTSEAIYLNSRRLLPSQIYTDTEQMVPVDDPYVLNAEKFIRNATNAQRLTYCSNMALYDQIGTVQAAKKRVDENSTVHYTIEVSYGNSTVFSRILMLPDTRNGSNPFFELIISIPGPCENELQDQLAVSSQGTYNATCT
jgi:hypothetical protein